MSYSTNWDGDPSWDGDPNPNPNNSISKESKQEKLEKLLKSHRLIKLKLRQTKPIIKKLFKNRKDMQLDILYSLAELGKKDIFLELVPKLHYKLELIPLIWHFIKNNKIVFLSIVIQTTFLDETVKNLYCELLLYCFKNITLNLKLINTLIPNFRNEQTRKLPISDSIVIQQIHLQLNNTQLQTTIIIQQLLEFMRKQPYQYNAAFFIEKALLEPYIQANKTNEFKIILDASKLSKIRVLDDSFFYHDTKKTTHGHISYSSVPNLIRMSAQITNLVMRYLGHFEPRCLHNFNPTVEDVKNPDIVNEYMLTLLLLREDLKDAEDWKHCWAYYHKVYLHEILPETIKSHYSNFVDFIAKYSTPMSELYVKCAKQRYKSILDILCLYMEKDTARLVVSYIDIDNTLLRSHDTAL